MRRRIIALLAACLLAAGCRHHPMYPAIGSLYITSEPSGAEVLLDGQLTRRTTPLKLDGIAEGDHEVRLRYFGFKVSRNTVMVGGGTTKRLAVKLAAILPRRVSSYAFTYYVARQMAYDPGTGRICVATTSNYLVQAQYHDGTVTPLGPIQLCSGLLPIRRVGQKLVAISPAAGKIYAVLMSDSIVVIDLNSGTILKRFKPAFHDYGVDSTNLVQLRLSGNGSTFYLADSLNRRIWVIDGQRDSLTGYRPLPGVPSDFLYDPQRDRFYATLSSTGNVAEVDATSGAVIHNAVAGYHPAGLYADDRWDKIGFGILRPEHPVTIELSAWVPVNGPTVDDGNDRMLATLFGADQTHLWFITSFTPFKTELQGIVCNPGLLHLVYLPTQQHVTAYQLSLHPVSAFQTHDGRYFIFLFGFYTHNSIEVYRTDTD